MEPRLSKIFLLVFLICCVSAKRYGGGGGSRSSGSISRSRPSPSRNTASHTSFSRPSSTSSNSGRTSSSNFLHAESGRPSLPANTYHPPPKPSYSHAPSAPVLSTNTHTNFGKPSSPVHENHQQNSAPISHNNPYEKPPAYNPYLTNGQNNNHGGRSPPYPVNQPNHPHPTNIGSSSYPSNGAYHPPTSGFHAPTSGAYQPPMNGAYHPQVNGAYQPPINGAYHPQVNGAYHPPINGAYHPQVNGAYHPPMNGAYHPPSYSQTPSHTVYVVPDSRRQSSGPGLGTYIASGVAGGVAAGATNAIVDHAISSIFRPNSHGVHTYPSAPAPGTPTTSVTNNYYYGNGAPAPAPSSNAANFGQPEQPAQTNTYNGQPAQAAPAQYVPPTTNNQAGTVSSASVSGGSVVRPQNGVVNRAPDQLVKPDESNFISDDELMRLSEELFDNMNTRVNQYVELNLQKRVPGNINDGSIPDEAREPLFIIKTGLDSIPTVSKLKNLYDHYQRNSSQKEIVSSERRNQENAFLDEVVKTPIMRKALNWLSEKHYVKPNEYDQKELLKNMWFTVFEDTSSGIERTFLSEIVGEGGISGMQNWIYFAHLEGKNMVDYMGYVDMLTLSGRGALLRINLQSEGIPMQSVPIFVGTPPELELALYTVCMHARYNGYCPVSLGGAKFYIYTHGRKENNNYLLDAGFPSF